jgi:anaphase-promoting complex subunit 8
MLASIKRNLILCTTELSSVFQLNSLILPDHWMKHFFLGHAFLEQQLNDDALDIYFALQQQGFEKSTYLIAQTAIAFHNRRGIPM